MSKQHSLIYFSFTVDTTRVVKDGGYINANFIKMPVKDENFLSIACQGPLLRTTEMVDDRLQITLVKDQHLDNFVVRMIEVKDIKVKSNSDLLFSFI